MSDKTGKGKTGGPSLGRRDLLLKLGLGATAIYAAPMLLDLGSARASDGSRPSRASRASRASRGTRGSGRRTP